MRTCWPAIFSSAKVVGRVLYVWLRSVFRSHTKGGFILKRTAGLEQVPTRGDLSKLLDVLAVFQSMSNRRRLGIKNEAEGYGLITLTQGKFEILDAEDYDRLNRYQWYAYKCKSNLRLCTNAQNCYNQRASSTGTSIYKGVSRHKCSRKWSARIGYGGKLYNLAYLDNEIEAAMVYDDKAVELFGEFAYLNFPERMERKKGERDCHASGAEQESFQRSPGML